MTHCLLCLNALALINFDIADHKQGKNNKYGGSLSLGLKGTSQHVFDFQ